MLLNRNRAVKYFLSEHPFVRADALRLQFPLWRDGGRPICVRSTPPLAGRAAGFPQGFDYFTILALVLIFAGLSFRLTAVPFHFYGPDVYQGTTHANAALLSVIPETRRFHGARARGLVGDCLTSAQFRPLDRRHVGRALDAAGQRVGPFGKTTCGG